MRQGKARSGRSNMYSESKCSNWVIYDPQQSEVNSLSRCPVAMTYSLVDGSSVRLYEVPLHQEFIRPFDCSDVAATLNRAQHG